MIERALRIDGWMEPSELEWLYETAHSMPNAASVVEIGSWKGRSTVALCEALMHCPGASIWAVDTFLGDEGVVRAAGPFDPDVIRDEFRRNTAAYGHLKVLMMESVKASSAFEDGSVDWVFIDADHSYNAVVADILAWAPKLKTDGLLSGHDYWHSGVMEAVLRSFGAVSRGAGSIWYTRRPPRSALAIAARRTAFWLRSRVTAEVTEWKRR
jgi:predicted O-methyltransferase YrrM